MSVKNELKTELIGMNALNDNAANDSPSRGVMFGSHISQRLVIDGCEEKIVQTGVEQQFSPYTFNVKMPESGRIIKIIERYPSGVGEHSLNFNPETVVIYENEETNEIDCFTIPYYASFHQVFGYRYKPTEHLNQVRQGASIRKGTVFADSPSVSPNGGYMYGLNLNTAFMSIPSVAEDGVVICEDVLERMKFRIYERRVVEFGTHTFPLNIHGNIEHYKAFPDIGDMISQTRSDGILMLLRAYDGRLSPVDMSIYDTQEPDFIFDKATYVKGKDGRVVDIKVIRNNSRIRQLPDEVTEQISKYEAAYLRFHEEIIKAEQMLRSDYKRKFGKDELRLSPKLHNMIVESMAIINYDQQKIRGPLNLLYKKDPIDEYRIEFVVEYEITPNIGYKISDQHGG